MEIRSGVTGVVHGRRADLDEGHRLGEVDDQLVAVGADAAPRVVVVLVAHLGEDAVVKRCRHAVHQAGEALSLDGGPHWHAGDFQHSVGPRSTLLTSSRCTRPPNQPRAG